MASKKPAAAKAAKSEPAKGKAQPAAEAGAAVAKSKAAEAEGKAAAAKNADAQASSENAIPKPSLTSAITSDLPQDAAETERQAKAEKEAQEKMENDQSFEGRALKAGIGLVEVDGIDFRYVGVAPVREGGKAETLGGVKIGAENSTFQALAQVPFSNSIRIKDPASGKYYYAPDGVTNWDACHLNGSYLIPRATEQATSGKPA